MASTTFNPRTKDKDDHMDHAKESASDALSKAQNAGKEAMSAAKEAGTDVISKVRDAGADALGKVGEGVSAAGQKADDMTASAGHGIKELGDKLAEKAPHEGWTGSASQAVAEGIKGAGQYIEQHKLSGMAHDVEQVIKSHPIPALLVCFGLGFCIGRAMKA